MIGTTLQTRYCIEAELGRGGIGAVYRATDTLTGDLVAVKALDPQVVARDSRVDKRTCPANVGSPQDRESRFLSH